MKPSRVRPIGVVLLLLLAGCASDREMVQMGMLTAPLAALMGAAVVHRMRRDWDFREPTAALRPLVLAAPVLLLTLSDGLMLLRLGSREASSLLKLLQMLWPASVLLTGCGLMVVTGIIWRIWFALAPRTSFEGAALLAPGLYFAPGLLVCHNVITDAETTGQVAAGMLAVCFYVGAYGGPLLALGLGIEARWARRKAATP